MVNVLFVCMGNVCRSPTAAGVFAGLVAAHALSGRVRIDSAGTHAHCIGMPPDPRAQEAARKRGIDLSGQAARRVRADDFAEFDHILAMDSANLADLRAECPPQHRYKLALFLEYAPQLGISDVPDPYYGGAGGFERVLDMIEAAAEGLLAALRRSGL